MKRTGTSVLLTRPVNVQLCDFTHFKKFIMMHFLIIYAHLTLLLNAVQGQDGATASNSTVYKMQNMRMIENLEVPDSALIFLSRLKFKRNQTIANIARQSQEESGENTSSRRCTCALGVCKCCTGYVMDLLKQKACMKITYNPGEFAFDVAMSLNDRVLYENSLSGKNPRPICISPPRLSNLKVCARFYNIFFPGRNFHFCLAMTGKWRSVELFNFAFDCLRMGANGIAMVKPDEGGGLPVANPLGGVDAVVDAGDDDIEEYDENNVVRSLLDILDFEE